MGTRAGSILASGQITLTNLDDTFTVSITSEAQVIPTTSNRVPLANKTYSTTITVYQGITPYTDFTIGNIASANGITVTKTANQVKFTVNTNTPLSAEDGEFVIPVIINSDITINKTFNWTCSKQGEGIDARYVVLNGEQVFMYTNNYTGNPTPASITLTAKAFGVTAPTYAWGYRVSGSDTVTAISGQTGATLVVAHNASYWGSHKQLTFRCTIDGAYYDEITIAKISSGSNGTNGKDGINGKDGADGQSTYFYVRYSANADGSAMTSTPNANSKYMGVCSTTATTAPTSPTSYNWSLIKGADGANGSQGATGADGKTSYLHIKYSNDGGKTFTSNNGEDIGKWMGTYVDFTQADSTNVASYTWVKFVGEDGTDGINGKDGKDGQSTYFYVRYSDNANGTPMTSSPTSTTKYMGTVSTTSATAPTSPASYLWTLIKGADGEKGIAGEKGDDGRSSYLHIKYSDNGTSFTANNGETVGKYIGTYVDYNEADSTVFSDYTWKKFVGEDGSDGKGVKSIVEQYYLSTSMTSLAGGSWVTTPPTASKGKFIWTRSVITYTDDTTTNTNPVCVSGADGTNGNDGVSITSVDVEYGQSSSATTEPTTWSTTAPEWVNGKFIWSRNKITLSNGKVSYTDSACITGQKGETGSNGKDAQFLTVTGEQVFKYTNNFTGNPTPTSITLTAVATGMTPSSYQWSYKLPTATEYTNISGATGATYALTHNASFWGSSKQITMRCTANGKFDDVTVIKVTDGAKGDTGETGSAGADAYSIVLSNESHTFAGSTSSALAGSTRCDVIAYKGSTKVAVTINSITGLPTGMTAPISGSGTTSAYFTPTVTTAMTTASGVLTINLTVDGKAFTKNFSYALALKGSTGSAGVSITSVDTEYYLSTSSTSVTGGSWSTTAPEWANGKYMWSRMKTTYSTGSTTYSNPVCITGQQGQTGGTGTGISSITEEYYLSTSKTTQTGGSWVTTPPTWKINTYLWTRNKIVYTNPSSTVYTTPVCDSSWEAINDITVGGDNLVANSKTMSQGNFSLQNRLSGLWYSEGYTRTTLDDGVVVLSKKTTGEVSNKFYPIYSPLVLIENFTQKVIMSFDVKIDVLADYDNKIVMVYELYDSVGTRIGWNDVSLTSTNWTTSGFPTQDGVWSRFKFVRNTLFEGVSYLTGKTKDDAKYVGLRMALAKNGSVHFKLPKVENGNTPSSWSLSPLDLQEEINNAVASVDVMYYLSTSNTSLAGGSWSTTAPVWTNGKYMWQKTVTTLKGGSVLESDPTCIAGATGSSGSDGKGIKSIVEQYYHSTSMTALAGGSWSTTVPTPVAGKYIWTRSIITYTDNSTTTTNGVCSTGATGSKGDKGDTGASGKGVASITEYYLATSASSGVTTSTSGWTTTIQSMTATNRYLWNYEVIKYTDNSTTTTAPIVIGVYGDTGNTGNGISSITNYYLATSAGSGVTTGTSGWTTAVQTMTSTNKYLWNYEVIKYTNSTTYTGTPRIIGVYGAKGDTGASGANGADAYTVLLSNENHTFPAEYTGSIGTALSTSSNVVAYKGATKVATTVGTITNPSGMTITVNSNGTTSTSLTITANSGTSLAETGSVNIPITVDGKSFTRVFSWTKVKKGGAGSNAKAVDIVPSTQYFKSTDGGITFTPNTITLTPVLQELTFSKWQYSVNGGSSYADVVSGSNGLTVSGGVLTIAKSSALYTKTVTSIVFKLITNNSSYYDTITIAQLYDVADLDFGGTNMLHGTRKWTTPWALSNSEMTTEEINGATAYRTNKQWGGHKYKKADYEKLIFEADAYYTYSVWMKKSSDFVPSSNGDMNIYGTATTKTVVKLNSLTTEWKRYSFTAKGNTWTAGTDGVGIRIEPTVAITTGYVYVAGVKLEKGNKPSDWTDSPKDLHDYAEDQVENQTQEFIFNKLTNNGALQGLYMENDKLYVNASYVKSGTFLGIDFIAGGAGNNGTVLVKDAEDITKFIADKNGVYATEINFVSQIDQSNGSYIDKRSARINSDGYRYSVTTGSASYLTDMQLDIFSNIVTLTESLTKNGVVSSSYETQIRPQSFVTKDKVSGNAVTISPSGISSSGQITSLSSVRGTQFTQSNYSLPIEIGQTIDFHNSGSTSDVDVRLSSAGTRDRLRISNGGDLTKSIDVGVSSTSVFIKNATSGQFFTLDNSDRLTYGGFTVPHNWRQSFTPFLYCDTGTFSSRGSYGQAIYLGDLVFVQGRVIATRGSLTGSLAIGGLPVSNIQNYAPVTFGFIGGLFTGHPATSVDVHGYVQQNAGHIMLNHTDRNRGGWYPVYAEYGQTGEWDITFSAIYRWR